MVQQFIELKHCKCGVSWEKEIGYFERTPDMVFALEQRTIGKKIKQVPVIRHKGGTAESMDMPEVDGSGVAERPAGSMPFNPISLANFLESYRKNNPTEDAESYRAALVEAVGAKKSGAVCVQCGSPIWAIGTATIGWDGCFTCITGEADCSDDYEIDSVCF
jgi:hypothetical protein